MARFGEQFQGMLQAFEHMMAELTARTEEFEVRTGQLGQLETRTGQLEASLAEDAEDPVVRRT